MDNGPELVSQALQRFCENKPGMVYVPPGRGTTATSIVQQRTTQGVPQPQPLDHPVRGSGGRRRLQARAQPPTPPLSAGLPHAGRVRCGMQAHPHPGGLPHQLNPEQTNPTLKPGGLSNGDSPAYVQPARHRAVQDPTGQRDGPDTRCWKPSVSSPRSNSPSAAKQPRFGAVVVAVASVIVSGFLSVLAVAHADACVNAQSSAALRVATTSCVRAALGCMLCRRSTRTVLTVMARISPCRRSV